jgi:hypothetical protein
MTERAVDTSGIMPTPIKDRSVVGKSQVYSMSKATQDLRAQEIQNLKQSRIQLQNLIE